TKIYAENKTLKLNSKSNGKLLFEQLFPMAELAVKEKWAAAKAQEEAYNVIKNYIVK
ncbi:MAG: hypothetical protein INR69_18765, partial [Mucilaginibacter polytrichastri]|nr:hypothetical protein [Mucilaginibacter polytrichastri]